MPMQFNYIAFSNSLMSRFASNGMPLSNLLDKVNDFRKVVKYGFHNNRRSKSDANEDDMPNVKKPSIDDDSSSDNSDSENPKENQPKKMLRHMENQPRPYSAAHYRLGVDSPNDSAHEHFYRQLCALCWLLDAISNKDSNMTVCPIKESWALHGLTTMKVNKHDTEQKAKSLDSNWSSFLSYSSVVAQPNLNIPKKPLIRQPLSQTASVDMRKTNFQPAVFHNSNIQSETGTVLVT